MYAIGLSRRSWGDNIGEITIQDRFLGRPPGLAGGALGATLEFNPSGAFQPIDDMVGGGSLGLWAGSMGRRRLHESNLGMGWASDRRVGAGSE